MAYFGKLLSNELLKHAIRTTPSLKDAQGKPLTLVTLRRKADGSLRTNGAHLRHKRRRLYKEQGGACYYCKGRMVLVERQPGDSNRCRRNEATIEHLDPRYSPERGKRGGEQRQVLACMGCNTERSRKDILAMSIQARWEMSWANFMDIAKRSGALNEVTE